MHEFALHEFFHPPKNLHLKTLLCSRTLNLSWYPLIASWPIYCACQVWAIRQKILHLTIEYPVFTDKLSSRVHKSNDFMIFRYCWWPTLSNFFLLYWIHMRPAYSKSFSAPYCQSPDIHTLTEEIMLYGPLLYCNILQIFKK